MASRGAQVVIADVDGDLGDLAAKELCDRGCDATFVATDITSRPSVQRLVTETCAHLGRIDALVHMAAICERAPFLDTGDALWQRTLDVCLTGTFIVNQEVSRVMVEQQGGRIINF